MTVMYTRSLQPRIPVLKRRVQKLLKKEMRFGHPSNSSYLKAFPTLSLKAKVWNGSWLKLYEIYGAPFDGTAPVGLSIRSFKGTGLGIGWQRNSTYGTDSPWVMPLVKNQWVTILTHERFATDGWVEMWVNGQRITFFDPSGFDYYNPNKEAPTQRLEMATMDSSNNESPNYAKISSYRDAGMFDSLSVYFSGLKIGTTRASVDG